MDSDKGLDDADYPAGAKSVESDHRVVGFLPDIVIILRAVVTYTDNLTCANGSI